MSDVPAQPDAPDSPEAWHMEATVRADYKPNRLMMWQQQGHVVIDVGSDETGPIGSLTVQFGSPIGGVGVVINVPGLMGMIYIDVMPALRAVMGAVADAALAPDGPERPADALPMPRLDAAGPGIRS